MTSTPSNAAGFLAARSQRLHEAMTGHVTRGSMPGATYAVSHARDVHVEAIGEQRLWGGSPMARDTIFRIASMTKPMAAAVAMMLVEDGVLGLDTPVDRWLAELANRRVLNASTGLKDTVRRSEPSPCATSSIVPGWLRHRVGIADALPIQRAANELRLGAWAPAGAGAAGTRRVDAALLHAPLMHQPGEGSRYNTSAEVLSVLLRARRDGRSTR